MFYQLLTIISGLLLFIYGMIKLSTKMQKVFSVRIRQYIKYLVKKPFSGMGIGALATAIFQSSSATTVLVVGMVNAGLISFFNSLGLILGAGIGTTITAQLVAIKITVISPVFIIAGILLWFFGKEKTKSVGEAIFYFGLLFFGLSIMSQGLSPLKQSPVFLNLIQGVKNPLLGVVIGFVFTALVQSSSATTSILVIFAHQGLITIGTAFPIVLGANMGTTVTAILASLGGGKNPKRAAFSHFFFKFFGVVVALLVLPFAINLLQAITSSTAQQIVVGHFLLSIFIALVFVFLLKPFSRFIKKIIPGEEKSLPLWPEYLDKKLLDNPQKALKAVAKELKREMMLAKRNYEQVTKLIFEFKKASKRSIFYIDLVINNLQKEIMAYLDGISRHQLSKKNVAKLFCYSAMVDDIERIGDHITNLARLAEYEDKDKVRFSKAAQGEIERIQELVGENIEGADKLIDRKSSETIRAVLRREQKVNELIKDARENHLTRFYKGICLAMAGPIFNDMLINFERISDHCENIAEYAEQISC